MSQALGLEGKVTIPRIIPPAPATIAALPVAFVDYFRVRIDPIKSDETNSFVVFNFDDGSSAGLHIRRAVAEYIENPDAYIQKPDIVIALSGANWAKLYLSRATPEEMIERGDLKVTCDATEAARLLNLFDLYSPQKAVVIPAATLDHQ